MSTRRLICSLEMLERMGAFLDRHTTPRPGAVTKAKD